MKKIIFMIMTLIVVFMIGCSTETKQMQLDAEGNEFEPQPGNSKETGSTSTWLDSELTDVKTGETFKISDFKGTPILVESFAVWCPTCTKQQGEFKKLHEEVGDQVISIALDTDPNEDEQKVLEHIDRNGFDWRYAVSPKELSQSLVDEFGVNVVNAPQAPVILVCEDLSSRLLPRGLKTAQELKEQIAEGC